MRNYLKKNKKEYAIFQLVVALVGVASYVWYKQAPVAMPQPSERSAYVVSRVVDGDTIKLTSVERVRLIGVDTPEVHESDKLVRDARRIGKDGDVVKRLGEKSSQFTRKMVDNKKVILKFDIKKTDRYGRLLAYVYLEDGTFINAEIIRQGYGQVMTIPPNVKYSDLFLNLERQARQNKKGLWKSY